MTRPRGGTRRDPSYRTDGARLAAVAAMLGTPLIPWQREVADIALEIDPDTGSFRYDTVVISTPRQCGKSALVDASDTYNASLGPSRRIVYAAQTGKDSEEHFKEYTEMLRKSRLRQKAAKFRFSNGGMSVRFTNGSTITPMAMTKVAGHGKQMDKVTIDEAFTLTREEGDTIMDAIVPTMNTRLKRTGVTAQRWITSTEGTAASTWFNRLLDGLRAGDVPRRTCWFDYGIPTDADPEDMETIMRWHPAAGYLWYRPQLADFREEFKGNLAGWARAFGNRRDEGIADRVISEDVWSATTVAPVDPATLSETPVTFGVAVDVDGSHTAISAGFMGADGSVVTQLVSILDGTGGAPAEVAKLTADYQAPIAIDTRGTAADLSDRLHQLTDQYGDPLLSFCEMDAADYLTIGQSYVSGLANGTIRHAADPELDASAANSTRKWAGDAWRLSRRGSLGLTSPLESCMLAAWGAAHRPEEAGPLQIF